MDLSQDYSLSRASSLANRTSIEARVWLVIPRISSTLARNVGICRFSWAVASRVAWMSLSKHENILGEDGIVQQILGTTRGGDE